MPSSIYVLKLKGAAVQGLPLKVVCIHPGTADEAKAWVQQSFAKLLQQGDYELLRYDCQQSHAAAVLCAEFPLQPQGQQAQAQPQTRQPQQPGQGRPDSAGYVPAGNLDGEDLF